MNTELIQAAKQSREVFLTAIDEQQWNTPMRTTAESLIIIYDQMIRAMEVAQSHTADVTRDDIERDLWTFRQDAMSWIDDLNSYKIFEQQLLKIINTLSRMPDGWVKVEDVKEAIYKLDKMSYYRYMMLYYDDVIKAIEELPKSPTI